MERVIDYLDKYHAAGGVGMPPQADMSDTVLTQEELNFIRGSHEINEDRIQKRLGLFRKMAADPKRCDVGIALESTCSDSEELVAKYTPEVHEQLRALIAPLKALVHDVDDENRATLRPPVRAIGMKLHELGGKKAQLAVYYGLGALLYDQVSHCDDGDMWSDTKSSLRFAWDGCGQWLA